jgi:hypothetical protein
VARPAPTRVQRRSSPCRLSSRIPGSGNWQLGGAGSQGKQQDRTISRRDDPSAIATHRPNLRHLPRRRSESRRAHLISRGHLGGLPTSQAQLAGHIQTMHGAYAHCQERPRARPTNVGLSRIAAPAHLAPARSRRQQPVRCWLTGRLITEGPIPCRVSLPVSPRGDVAAPPGRPGQLPGRPRLERETSAACWPLRLLPRRTRPRLRRRCR